MNLQIEKKNENYIFIWWKKKSFLVRQTARKGKGQSYYFYAVQRRHRDWFIVILVILCRRNLCVCVFEYYVKLMRFIVYIFCPFLLTSKHQSLKQAHNFRFFFFVYHKFMCLLNYFMA